MNLLEDFKLLEDGAYSLAFEQLACYACKVVARRGVLCGVPVGPDGCPECGRKMAQVCLEPARVFDGCVLPFGHGGDDTSDYEWVAPVEVAPTTVAVAAEAAARRADAAEKKEAAAERAKAMDRATPASALFERNHGHAVGSFVSFVGTMCPVVAHAVFEGTAAVLDVCHNVITGNLIVVPVDGSVATALPLHRAYETGYPVHVPGTAFRHFKGGTYRWYGLAAVGLCGSHPFMPGPLVVYRSDEKQSLWVRTLVDFYADVTDRVAAGHRRVARFTRIEDTHGA